MTATATLTHGQHLLLTMIGTRLGLEPMPITEDRLAGELALQRGLFVPDMSDEEAQVVLGMLRERISVALDLGVAITSAQFKPWLVDKQSEIDWVRWQAYKKHLLDEGFPIQVVDRMDETTDDIVELVGDPTQTGTWARRGLVIGDVQSGKTASYLAILDKAADAGYKLIIVLAGTTESLRQQTQTRIDEGFIGRDSRNAGLGATSVPTSSIVGVGRFDQRTLDAIGMTTAISDFRKASNTTYSLPLNAKSTSPYIFVLKKNKTVLAAVKQWLTQQAGTAETLDMPLLMLDDESDYASVNTRAASETDPTAINKAIRELLALSHRSSYLAFTATPFANIFIDHSQDDDLFPGDFIYALEPPSNYVGADVTFGDASKATVLHPSDAHEHFAFKHKSDLQVTSLPESLHEAIRAFALANAVRDLRGHRGGRSMLVNVTRFIRVQEQVEEQVAQAFGALRNSIEFHSRGYAEGVDNDAMERLESTYHKLYRHVDESWDQVLHVLPAAVKEIRVELYNSNRDKSLGDHPDAWRLPRRVIAIGGDVLSRGLTLDGLMTSYFYRRAGAADTLLQMARWFGYRDGYTDLCRLWIDPVVAQDFKYISESVTELRADLRLMHAQKLTPHDFGITVRDHPEALLITARNKMRSGELMEKSISLSGRSLETRKLLLDPKGLNANLIAFTDLLERIRSEHGPIDMSPEFRNFKAQVSKDFVADFLASFEPHPRDLAFAGTSLGNFVRSAVSPSLQTWDVVVMTGTGSDIAIAGEIINRPRRSIFVSEGDERVGRELAISSTSGRVASAADVANNLVDKGPRERIKAEFLAAEELATGKKKNDAPESRYFASLLRPALMLYPIEPNPGSEGEEALSQIGVSTVVAAKIVMPGEPTAVGDRTKQVRYVANSVAQLKGWLPELITDGNEDAGEIDA